MSSRPMRDSRGEGPPRRTRARVLLAVALGLAAAILGPLAAIAAAGSSPPPSGGGGLITSATTGPAMTVTTATVLATSTTGTGGARTTTCSEPAVGTVTSATSTTRTATTTSTTATRATITTRTATTATTATRASTTTSTAPTSTYPAGTTTAAFSTPTPAPTTTTRTTPATTTTTTVGTPTTTSCAVPPPTTLPAPSAKPLAARGMWIWELPVTDGGNVARVIAQAKQYGIKTLYVKSGDGTELWSQFNPTLVDEFHAAGLDVCAWQYVYGVSPVTEAAVGAQAVKDGADCLVIDAEVQYQGKYAQAQTYLTDLRARIGAKFPVALAGFPYVDYHPTFPYSVFLGPGGAQYNLPQMYWQDIGTTVTAVYAHTYEFNELYQRPIYPLGQLFDSPPVASVKRFRSVGLAYRATGVNWWDWQSASAKQFSAISAPAGPIKHFTADTTVASLARGALGDVVVLAQEHLWNTPERVAIDGDFGRQTEAAVRRFQTAHGLPATGIITPQTWTQLLKVPLPTITWVTKRRSIVAKVSA